MLFFVFPLHFGCFNCFRLEKVSLLLPHSRCNSLHFSGFFAISISFRFCRYLVHQFVLFLITGVLSHCYTFSLKATTLLQFSRHEKFIYSFVPSWSMLFIAFLLLFIQEILPGTIALAFNSLRVCVPASSLLFCHYYQFFPSLYYHTFYSKLCFSFSGMRSSLFVVASRPMFFIALLLWFIT